ncbi:hypothetical protein SAMN05660649_02390 [Desulfotomaculum arcticum]|uniref:YhhN-like protein n=1 Tax=Desulfotruncus arcticus DSM 17038 TaxID=1121424 RepID=A0A1I2TX98_9FIRM|nr:hypothetical protein [Desulfotruncus arcticus]SFG69508.1 hypothetical protein SAMN05660649_02390 [Desulfotomaculum arcticum] [Desulfotruncus arcticus DSM 17038]
MSPKLFNFLVFARNIVLVLLLFFGLRFENADAQRYGTLLGLMVVYVILVRLREFPFVQNSRFYYTAFYGDVILIALINYHSQIYLNYFFLLLYYLSILSAGAYLSASKALAVNVFTLAALVFNLAGLAEQNNAVIIPLLWGLPAVILAAIAFLVRRKSMG